MARTVEGKLDARGIRFAIVISRFNSFVSNRLLTGAMDGLERSGALQAEERYSGGRRQGLCTTYYENGVVQYQDTYTNGRLLNRKAFTRTGALEFSQDYAGEE